MSGNYASSVADGIASGQSLCVDVRRAELGDAEAIAEVHVRSWQEAYADLLPHAFLASLSIEHRVAGWRRILASTNWPSSGTLVLTELGSVTGFANVGPSSDEDASDRTAELTAIYLRRDVWGRGGGRALMTEVLRTCTDAGFDTATLWVLDGNDRARRFSEAGGWREDGTARVETIADGPVKEIRYRRPLPA